MADVKLTDHVADVSPTIDDILYSVNDPAGAKESKKITIENLFKTFHLEVSGTELVFNEAGADVDFRVEASGVDPALFVRGSDGFVGIGYVAPAYRVHIRDTVAAEFVGVSIENAGANSTSILLKANTDATGKEARLSVDATGNIVLRNTANSGGSFYFDYKDNVIFRQNAANEEMRLTSAGLLQIGAAAGAGNVNITPQSAITGLFVDMGSQNTVGIDIDSNGTLACLRLKNDGSGPHITTGATNEDLEIDPNGTGDINLLGHYTLRQQNIPDLASKGPAYWFDGSDDVITIASDANLNFGTGDFSIVASVNTGVVNSAYHIIYSKGQAATPNVQLQLTSGNTFRFIYEDAGGNSAGISDEVAVVDKHYHLVGVADRSGVSVLYINGHAQVSQGAGRSVTVDNAIESSIGRGTASLYWGGAISNVNLFNLALSADEVKALSSGAPVPFKYVGASQTEMITDSDNQDFDDASINEWTVYTNGDGTCVYDAGPGAEKTAKVTVGATPGTITGGQLATTEMTTLEAGKTYLIKADVYIPSSNNNFSSVYLATDALLGITTRDQQQANVATEDSWQTISREVILADDITGSIVVGGASTSTGDIFYFDNISVTQIGCVLQLEQDGITHDKWIDKSGNSLDGTVSGAITTNLNVMKPVYIPAVEFDITTGNTGDINSTGIHGHSMTDGELSTLSYKPLESLDVDITKPLYVQVVWCCIDGTVTNGVTWLVTYDNDTFESGVLTAPATALNTVIVEDLENDIPYTLQKTEKGVIDANSLTVGAPIAFRVEADVVDSASDPGCWFMGLLLSQ